MEAQKILDKKYSIPKEMVIHYNRKILLTNPNMGITGNDWFYVNCDLRKTEDNVQCVKLDKDKTTDLDVNKITMGRIPSSTVLTLRKMINRVIVFTVITTSDSRIITSSMFYDKEELDPEGCWVCSKKNERSRYKNHKKCSKCKLARFCSVECQKKSWSGGHKIICTQDSEIKAKY